MPQHFKNTQPDDSDLGLDLDSVQSETSPTAKVKQSWLNLSLFWRTFILLSVLLTALVLAWLQTYRALQVAPIVEQTAEKISTTDYSWLAWLTLASVLSIVGVGLMARLINRPFEKLSFAASRFRGGDYNSAPLHEKDVGIQEREVHEDFNRMAAQLAKIEQDRAVMLAGISHDLRTPLARLRLETEMSVSNEDAKAFMVADIEQLDAIIDKFMDYARPGDAAALQTICLNDVISQCVVLAQQNEDIQCRLDLPSEFFVIAEEVDLRRVIGNLIENARKYGKTPGTAIAQVDIAARERHGQVIMKLLDHGLGVPPDVLRHLTKPFYRADEARTSATGAGLGLAIVEKTVQRMGGQLGLANSIHGGLIVTLKLQAANSV